MKKGGNWGNSIGKLNVLLIHKIGENDGLIFILSGFSGRNHKFSGTISRIFLQEVFMSFLIRFFKINYNLRLRATQIIDLQKILDEFCNAKGYVRRRYHKWR